MKKIERSKLLSFLLDSILKNVKNNLSLSASIDRSFNEISNKVNVPKNDLKNLIFKPNGISGNKILSKNEFLNLVYDIFMGRTTFQKSYFGSISKNELKEVESVIQKIYRSDIVPILH